MLLVTAWLIGGDARPPCLSEQCPARGRDADVGALQQRPADQHWYFRALAAAFLFREPDNRLFWTLDDATRALFLD